jgi:hypothetical protein
MRYLSSILFLIIATAVSCTPSKEIEIRLSNPQGIVTDFDGYYQVNTDTEMPMTNSTPYSYDFSLVKGDQLVGQIWKSDSSNFTDTLRFQVFVDGVEHTNMTYNLLVSFQHIQFSLSVQ